ncbi:MAG: T9SS type A sorting domain-containing protein, partial [Bacteroidota bacterium]
WTLPNGWSGSSTSTSINAIAGTTSGTVTVRANNGCGSSAIQSRSVTVSPTPVQPSAISGTSTACPNASVVYSVTAVNGATGYNWSLPSGWNGVSSTNSIIVSAGTSSGTISVTATNGCGTGAAQTMALTTGTAPARPGSISGIKTVCTGSQQTYSFTSVAGATSYIWTLPSGWSGASNTNSITVNVGSTSGTISAVSVNGCGISAARNKSLVVPKAVVQPGSITGSVALCNGSTQTYSVSAVANATSYLWSLPNGWTGSSNTNSINVVVGSTGGVVSVRAENACFVSAFRTTSTSVKPVPNPTVARSGNNLVVSPVISTDVLHWFFNGNTVAGTNDTIHCVGIGNYSCMVTSSFGCNATSPVIYMVTCGPQPRMGEADPEVFSIFPNPAQGAFTITLPEGNSTATVEVYDPYGNLVYKHDYADDNHQPSHQVQLDVAKGIYFVNVRTGGETTMQKLIIE